MHIGSGANFVVGIFMRKFFAPNIGGPGRIVRLVLGIVLIIGAFVVARYSWWACGVLAVSGAFGLYEAFRGWCLMRACGIKTKL